MNLDCFSSFLSKKLRILGMTVATHPSYFIIISVFVSIVLSTGLQNWHEKNNVKYLLAPDNTRHVKEEATIENLFPMNLSSNANIEKMTKDPCFATVLITVKNEGSVLRPHIFQEILLLDKIIQNITVIESNNLKYKDLCAKNNKRCFNNIVLSFEDKIEKMMKGNYSIKYPLEREGEYGFHLNALFLGGVEVDANNNVKNAKAINLYYYLNDDSVYQSEIAKQWLVLFLQTISSTSFEFINVDRYTSITIEQELRKVIHRVFPRMPLAIFGILMFSMLTCLHDNWVESKPWIGVIALISGGMALGSSFGLIMYFNVPFIGSTGTIPFLILGIGMDDAFVFIAAWRRTDRNESVSYRTGEVYSKSGISVTITSVTNFIAFISGLFTPFRIVRYFCLYASIAVVFCYIYQMTVVGACMAICGYLEKQNRHSLLFVKLENVNEDQTWFRRIFCTIQSWKSENTRENIISIIWIKFGNMLTLWPVKIFFLLLLVSHTAVGIWGIKQIDIRSDSSQTSPSDSYYLKYLENSYKYFYLYKHRFQIVIDQQLNYADSETQTKIDTVLSNMEAKGLIADSLTESWLRSFMEFINNKKVSFIIKEYNMSDPNDFITILHRIFLRHPAAQRFRNDIVFNSNYIAIIGSRFFCQTNITLNDKDTIRNVQELRKVTNEAPFSIFPYFFYSYLADNVDLHVSIVIQLLISIVIIIIVICFIFMPDIINTFSIAFSILSIQINLIGYMALWNVELSTISIVNLLVCSGFSVDYSAHLSHAFRQSKSLDNNQRIRDSIDSVGHAIFQGSVTTIISILPLAYPLAYIFVASFKIIFLVILFSSVNALIFLPILSATFNDAKNFCMQKVRSNVSNDTAKANSGGNINPIEISD